MTLSIETLPEAETVPIQSQSFMLLWNIEERYADAKLNIFSEKMVRISSVSHSSTRISEFIWNEMEAESHWMYG